VAVAKDKGACRMKYFGTKQSNPTNADQVALDRLSAIASRYRVDQPVEAETELPLDFPEVEPEPDAQQ
jgi:hypothetical protein